MHYSKVVGLLFKSGEKYLSGVPVLTLGEFIISVLQERGRKMGKGKVRCCVLCYDKLETAQTCWHNEVEHVGWWNGLRSVTRTTASCPHGCTLHGNISPSQESRSVRPLKGKTSVDHLYVRTPRCPCLFTQVILWCSKTPRCHLYIYMYVLGLRSFHSHTFKSFKVHNLPLYGLSFLITKAIHVNGSK